eukprot:495236_1
MESEDIQKSNDLFYSKKQRIAISWTQFFVGIAFYILSYYLFDDGLGEWTITPSNIYKATIGMILLPFGLILWQSAIFRLSSPCGSQYHYIVNITFLFIFMCALFVVGGIYFVVWGLKQFLEWDYYFNSPIKMVQSIYLILTLWLTGITLFYILCRAVLQRNLYSKTFKNDMDMDIIKNDNRCSKLYEYSGIFLFFFIYIPLFLLVNTVMVSDWHKMTPVKINQKLQTWSITNSWHLYIPFDCLEYISWSKSTTCYARLYYDLYIWYGFIFCVSLFSYFTNKSKRMKLLFQKRVYYNYCFGQCIFWLLWSLMMISIGYYFAFKHLWEDDKKYFTVLEKSARFIGILSIQFCAFTLFTSTRIRLWTDCFMVSFEHLVIFHRIFGILTLFTGYLHIVLWLIFWYKFDSNLWTFSYHNQDWTVIIMFYIMIFIVPITYIFGTLQIIRRKYFEIFYYLHLFGGLIFIGCLLWHAAQSWRYLIPPLSLYAIDRMIRLSNSSKICHVNYNNIGNISIMNGSVGITKLSFSIGNYNMKNGESSFKNINFKMGQFVFINISNISLFEWHPFTITNGEHENDSYLLIQSKNNDKIENNHQFCNLLYSLAQNMTCNNNNINKNEIEIHVDGPYGVPFEYDEYEQIILIAGGIGITPCHSIFSTMLSRYIYKYNNNQQILPSVHLFWICKDSKMFSLFTETWQLYENHIKNNKFNVKLFVTKYSENDDHVVTDTNGVIYSCGRPNWHNLLQITTNKTFVFSCGPQSIMDQVEKISLQYGAKFHSESFNF